MNQLTDAEIITIAEGLGLCTTVEQLGTIWFEANLIPFARAIEQRLAQSVTPTNFVGYATGIEPNSGS